MKKSIIITLALAFTSTLFAQKDSLNAVINVENDYAPVVTKATKKGFTPQTETTASNAPLALEFSLKRTPFRGLVIKKEMAEKLIGQEIDFPGYTRLAYGIGDNIDGKISYQHEITKRDNIKAMASIEGFSCEVDGPVKKWDSRMFSSWVSTDYSHSFDKLILGVGGYFENNVFNYQRSLLPNKQNNKKYDIHVNGASQLAGPFAYNFNAGIKRNHYKYLEGMPGSYSQNNLYLNGLLKHELDDERIDNINLGIELDNYTYSGSSTFEGFFSATLNPYTDIIFEKAQIHIGAFVNILSDNGSMFAIAPDLEVEFPINKKISLYTTIKGGRTAGTFEAMENVTPYWINIVEKPAYTIADATIGARFAHKSLAANVFTGYTYTKDDFLNYSIDVVDRFDDSFEVISAIGQENTSKIFIGANATYDYAGWLKLFANTRYNYWKCDKKEWIGTKPEFELNLNAESRIFKHILINLAYNFATYGNDQPSKNKNELNLRAGCNFMKRFGVFVEGNNLLNQEYVKYAGYYEQGVNILIGASAKF